MPGTAFSAQNLLPMKKHLLPTRVESTVILASCLAPFFLIFKGMKYLCLFIGLLLLWSSVGFAGEFLVYFGTYTGAKSEGIYVSRFDPVTGRLSAPQLSGATRNPR